MSTVLGMRVADGVAIVGDRRETRDGQVVSDDLERVVEIEGIGLGATGSAAAVQFLHSRFGDRVRRYAHEHGGSPGATAVERILAELCPDAETPALAAARDERNEVDLLVVDSDGGTSREPVSAIGTGAELAIGALDRLDRDIQTDDASGELREIMIGLAERDTDTGESIDVVTVRDRT